MRVRLTVGGVVQGVGFRPFVHGLAAELGLAGHVTNTPDGVVAEVEGVRGAVDEFRRRLVADAPPLAAVTGVTGVGLPPLGGPPRFVILPSLAGTGRTLLPADTATCDACAAELADPGDRRHRHPFITCTHCGPRFTIATRLPYDRAATTMAPFPLCEPCAREYADPGDRRFHAQPVACPRCGPRLYLTGPDGSRHSGEAAMAAARELLADGAVLAVKGIGGYHLACDAANEGAVARLRARKERGGKPFAVMAADLAVAEALAPVGPAEERALTGRRRPVVLLRRDGRTAGAPALAASVCPGSPDIGVMLPYTPLHHLLLGLPGDRPGPRVLVMTSGNRSGEPLATGDADALARLRGIADAWLWHDRAIRTPCDDSVVRVRADGGLSPVRRSRGFVPEPVALPFEVPPSLAVGGDLKNVFCLAEGRTAWLSQHIGDLDVPATAEVFRACLDHLRALTGVRPRTLACDLHPGYRSARWAVRNAGDRPLHRVQHHHAHVASAMADAGCDGRAPVIGVAFDGTGYGDDGAVWGGEILLADYAGYRRLAHLSYVPLPGGDAAVRRPYRMALSHLRAAGIGWSADLPCAAACPDAEQRVLARQLETGTACVPTSSMGRFFDAVSSLLGVCHEAGYEAQAAVELEARAAPAMARCGPGYVFGHARGGAARPGLLDPAPVLRALVADLRSGTATEVMAARLHHAVADAVSTACRAARRATGVTTVALTGGVFTNALLDEACADRLRRQGFTVLRHQAVPCGDGGLALGQLLVAARRPRPGDRPPTDRPAARPGPDRREGSVHVPGSARQSGEH
ncbi:carbamoyltransferase HypF [Streptomyces sp. HPF1205]|uniref:carbamoyltransferase HypF n=1 Tax=Streptomyces sp. HPF1205 TaxID=2873262 RepID=UPI001CED5968|nr:carbamoyltransferase HypF [Streptomyces sp. HPF1205]